MLLLRALWAYKGFVFGSIRREFQSRYQGSVLGAIWTVLQPLAMILVYTLVFSEVMRARLSSADTSRFGYSIYLCAGTLTWALFAEIVSRGVTVFVDNGNLIKKLNFPRMTLPVTVVANALVNFGIVFSMFTVFLVASGNFPGWTYFALIPVVALLVLLAIGIGIALGILHVFFRDVGQLLSIVLQFWFWLTPIVYPLDILPAQLRSWIDLNPMARVVEACQEIVVHHQTPDWARLAPVLAVALLLCAWAWTLFRRHAGELVDEL